MKLIDSDHCCKLVEFLITFYKCINLEQDEVYHVFLGGAHYPHYLSPN